MAKNENAPQVALRSVETSNAAQASTLANDSAERAFLHQWRSAVYNSRLRPGPKLALIALAEFADETGNNCYPSHATIGKLCSANEKTIRTNLESGLAAGFLSRFQTRSGKAWAHYRYQLLVLIGADTRRPTEVHRAEKTSAPRSDGAEESSVASQIAKEELSGPSDVGSEETSAAKGASSGTLRQMVRKISPDGAEESSYDLALDLAHRTRKEESALSSDDKAVVWSKGLSLLTKSGLQESKARSVIGMLRKILRHDDTVLIELVNEAERQQIAKPEAWLIAAVARRQASPFARVIPASEEQANADADRALALFGAAP
jgi:hypothetical protein